MKHPVNVYWQTEYWEHGLLECVYDGFGYHDSEGDITLCADYNLPKDDEFHLTTIATYGNSVDLTEIYK